jgi:hypothetical protein
VLNRVRATVTAIVRADAASVELSIVRDGEQGGGTRGAVAYPALTGAVAVGDRVVLNTTACDLKLGTGGLDFVIHNESRPLPKTVGDADGAHIMKLRYTPLQHAVAAAEMDPRHAPIWEAAATLMRTPVVVGNLHSQIAAAAAAVKAARPDARVAYVMTDGAALPIGFSRLVRDLKDAGLIDVTLTAGQAFGGDYECVTVASALLAARFIARGDVVLVCQGPGNAGTGTRFGFSGIEQGAHLDLAGRLWGTPIGVLRVSFADRRARHHGLSHHTVTALGLLAQAPALLAFPAAAAAVPDGVSTADLAALRAAVDNSPLAALHEIVEADGAAGLALLAERSVSVTSMGRSPADDPIFFHAAAAAGALAAQHVRGAPAPTPG